MLVGKFASTKEMKHVCAHAGMKFVNLDDNEMLSVAIVVADVDNAYIKRNRHIGNIAILEGAVKTISMNSSNTDLHSSNWYHNERPWFETRGCAPLKFLPFIWPQKRPAGQEEMKRD